MTAWRVFKARHMHATITFIERKKPRARAALRASTIDAPQRTIESRWGWIYAWGAHPLTPPQTIARGC